MRDSHDKGPESQAYSYRGNTSLLIALWMPSWVNVCYASCPSSKCVSRDQELAQSKSDKQVVTLENHQLHVKAKGSNLEANLSNELRVRNAMIRRGLALDQGGLMTFAMHDTIMRNFLSHITRPAPPGFAGPDIQSVLRADHELWTRCADVCNQRFGSGQMGGYHLTWAEESYTTPTVVFHLLPVPSRGKRSCSDSPRKENLKEKKEKKNPRSDKTTKVSCLKHSKA